MTPLTTPTRLPVAERGENGQGGRAMVPPDDRADHRAQRQVRADRQVDAPGEDDEKLADREDADHRRLLEDVADVLERQEHVRQDAEHRYQDQEDHDRTEPQGSQGHGQPTMRRGGPHAGRLNARVDPSLIQGRHRRRSCPPVSHLPPPVSREPDPEALSYQYDISYRT